MDSGVNARYLASSEFIDFLPDQLVDEWLIVESSHKREIVYFIVNANILRVIITFMSPDPDCGQDASVLLIDLNTKAAKERTKDARLKIRTFTVEDRLHATMLSWCVSIS